jgi:hypothetical protein
MGIGNIRGDARTFRKSKSSFLKKRTKKLLQGCRGLVGESREKVFASFFKKKRFLATLWHSTAIPTKVRPWEKRYSTSKA